MSVTTMLAPTLEYHVDENCVRLQGRGLGLRV
jgi:hypothetical protein